MRVRQFEKLRPGDLLVVDDFGEALLVTHSPLREMGSTVTIVDIHSGSFGSGSLRCISHRLPGDCVGVATPVDEIRGALSPILMLHCNSTRTYYWTLQDLRRMAC